MVADTGFKLFSGIVQIGQLVMSAKDTKEKIAQVNTTSQEQARSWSWWETFDVGIGCLAVTANAANLAMQADASLTSSRVRKLAKFNERDQEAIIESATTLSGALDPDLLRESLKATEVHVQERIAQTTACLRGRYANHARLQTTVLAGEVTKGAIAGEPPLDIFARACARGEMILGSASESCEDVTDLTHKSLRKSKVGCLFLKFSPCVAKHMVCPCITLAIEYINAGRLSREALIRFQKNMEQIRNYIPIPAEFEDDIILSQFVCPITHYPIRHPITLSQAGGERVFHFEKAALLEWFQACCDKEVDITNPINRDPLNPDELVDNVPLQLLINERLQTLEARRP